MENSIRETNIDRTRTRPRFTIETSIAPKDYEQILKEHLRTEFSGQALQCGLSLCFCILPLQCFGWCSSRQKKAKPQMDLLRGFALKSVEKI